MYHTFLCEPVFLLDGLDFAERVRNEASWRLVNSM